MASRSKQKGSRWEREFCKKIGGAMVPLSGALAGLPGDVRGSDGLLWECKHYKTGFVTLYKLLVERDALAIKIDYKDPIVVMRLATYLEVKR